MRRQRKSGKPGRSRKRLVALGSLALIASLLAAIRLRREGPTGWNLVLVSVDTLRADHLSCYGGAAVRTPHLDRLASEGVLYENVSTVAPTTLPAHASLFTALTPIAHGVHDNVGFYLDERSTTLAAHLKGQGYDTAAFVGAFVLDSRFGLDRGFDLYDDDIEGAEEEGSSGFVAQRRGAEVLESALDWLRSRDGNERPFFAFLHFYDPHTPYEPPVLEGYPGEVAYVDSLVGRLSAFLAERGLRDRTLVVLTSDHGESLGEHGEATHGLFLYQSTLRIPLLFRYPGAPAGRRITEPMHITHVASRILEVLRLPPLPGGRRSEGTFYAETYVPRLHYGWSELRSVTEWPHKLVMAPRPELYDLSNDPGEARNRIEDLPEVARALAGRLESMKFFPVDPRPVDRETLEPLIGLGYVGPAVRAEGALPDPKDRLPVYRILNDPAIQGLRPEDGARFEKALADLKDVLAREPRIPRTYALYGELLLRAGRAETAAGTFERLVALDGRSFEGHYGLGVALQALNRREAAIEALGKAVEVDPRNTKPHLRLAEIELSRGDPRAAEGWLRRAMAVHEDPALAARLAQVLLQSGKGGEARLLLERLAADSPHDGVAAYNLGQLLLVEGEGEEALAALERAVSLSPSDPDVHQALGTAFALSGRREEAIESFRRAVELAPCFAAAQANLGAAYAELRRFAEAETALERAVSCDPTYAAGYKNLAALRFQRGDLDGAIAAMREARRASPEDGEIEKSLEELVDLQRRRKGP
jgi:arylsulfatase A-like enzyme/Flp pilus assembly protein TadD